MRPEERRVFERDVEICDLKQQIAQMERTCRQRTLPSWSSTNRIQRCPSPRVLHHQLQERSPTPRRSPAAPPWLHSTLFARFTGVWGRARDLWAEELYSSKIFHQTQRLRSTDSPFSSSCSTINERNIWKLQREELSGSGSEAATVGGSSRMKRLFGKRSRRRRCRTITCWSWCMHGARQVEGSRQTKEKLRQQQQRRHEQEEADWIAVVIDTTTKQVLWRWWWIGHGGARSGSRTAASGGRLRARMAVHWFFLIIFWECGRGGKKVSDCS